MLNVNIDHGDPASLHEQVTGQIRRAIAEGEAAPGERLPLAKDLAAVLGVNKNTVLRALHELRDEGLLEFRRGRGITVAGTPERGAVLTKVRELIEFARHHGYGHAEVIQMIEGLPRNP
jgi:GntR family transcriptional regulator